MTRFACVLVLASMVSPALAQPAPAPSDGRVDAKALLQSGVRLLNAKDYLGALAVFRDAYARFASAKILLNIGTTLLLLGQQADAANAYQRYLDAEDADPAKKADVATALADLDKAVGRISITVTPADAEVQVDDGEWMPASRVRVTAGSFTVRARKEGYTPVEETAQIAAGQVSEITLALALPSAPALPPVIAPDAGDIVTAPAIVVVRPRARLGVNVAAHIDALHGGAAAVVGPTLDATTRLEVQLAAILGPTYGAYAGARFAILTGAARPYLALGVPVFFSHGTRVGGRGAGGFELRLSRTVALFAEAGVEVMANPGTDIVTTAFIPAVGATGRL